jgi:hypothetical protein
MRGGGRDVVSMAEVTETSGAPAAKVFTDTDDHELMGALPVRVASAVDARDDRGRCISRRARRSR